MPNAELAIEQTQKASWKDYLELCKPRVVLLMVLTVVVGMCLAAPGVIPWQILLFGNVGIALAACSAAAVNHLADMHIDRVMKRTMQRPMVKGKVSPKQTMIFAGVMCLISMVMLTYFVNGLTAILSFASLIMYAFIYTFYLKHATPQNIVIGGVAGAAPPLLGWVAVTGHVQLPAIVLLLIIFVWTPPHFWALAIHRIEDYAKANVPMLPNTHGIPYTKNHVWYYSILLAVVTAVPFFIQMSGWIYLISAVLLNARFLQWAWRLKKSNDTKTPMAVFKYSIVYLMLLFVALLVDHYLRF
ncbi:MAG: heme o synthase [Coxiellaceae bacterium]|nr:heme o synthase [Coxiellaceae bacterium]